MYNQNILRVGFHERRWVWDLHPHYIGIHYEISLHVDPASFFFKYGYRSFQFLNTDFEMFAVLQTHILKMFTFLQILAIHQL